MSMYARVTSVELGDDADRAISLVRDQIVPLARQQEGIVAAYWLGDRDSGRGLAVTIWESENAMIASEAVAREAARREQQDADVQTETVEHYEVFAQL